MIGASAAALVLPLLSARPLAALTERAFAARFFTPAEFAMVDELSDLIIPTDEVSPGARAARVAGEIDRRIGRHLDPEPKTRWRAGLRAVNDLAREMTGKAFMQATPDQRLAVLTRMAANESRPQDPRRAVLRLPQALHGAGVLLVEGRHPPGPALQGERRAAGRVRGVGSDLSGEWGVGVGVVE